MVIERLVAVIRNQLADVISAYTKETGQDVNFEVCSFRDMMEKTQTLEEDSPRRLSDRSKLFFVVSVGKGQRNFAVEETPVTIQCLSMENTVASTYDILASYVSTWSFCEADGYIQVYFMPTVMSASAQVFTGFRALCEVTGTITTTDKTLLMFDQVVFYDGASPLRLPFVTIGYSYQASSDPRAFSQAKNENGTSLALNSTNVKTLSLVTYMWNFTTDGESRTKFSSMVMEAIRENQNKKFHIALHTNLTDDRRLSDENPWIDDWYVLKSASTQQSYYDPSTWTLVFAKAREKEDGE